MKRIILIILIVLVILSVFVFFICRSRENLESFGNRLSKARLEVRNGNLKKAESSYLKIINDFKDTEDLVATLDELADIYHIQNQLLKTKQIYLDIIRQYPESENISKIQKKLWDLNIEILFSGLITKYSVIYEVKTGDTLSKIAKKFMTTVDLIRECNVLKSDVIRPDDRLKIVKVKFNIMVDKSQNILTLRADDEILKIYSVSTGKDNCTPVGDFEIINKLKEPVHYKMGQIIPAESSENILGSRWMGLSIKEYGIHGTRNKESIGKQITQGCVRMRNKDVEELFTIVPIGTKVTIVD